MWEAGSFCCTAPPQWFRVIEASGFAAEAFSLGVILSERQCTPLKTFPDFMLEYIGYFTRPTVKAFLVKAVHTGTSWILSD